MGQAGAERDERLLRELLTEAGLPAAVSTEPITGRGFDHTVYRVTLGDGRQVVLRSFREPRAPEHARAAFLARHGAPAPAFLAGNAEASLHAFAPGTLLGDLIETNQATAASWRSVGRAYARTHAVTFPAGLEGEVEPAEIRLRLIDPVAELQRLIDEAAPGLEARMPGLVGALPALRAVIKRAGPALRSASTSLGHGDIHMWNILVTDEETTLIDWDFPRVSDPALEIALLDKHASLFNGFGLDPAFFAGYGRPAPEPNTSIHRVTATLQWATSGDWDTFARDPLLSAELKERGRAWEERMWAYVARLPEHIERVTALTP